MTILCTSKRASQPSFLTKLSTLRDFVNGMGVKVAENDLLHALKNSGYVVELALERILSNKCGSNCSRGYVSVAGAPNIMRSTESTASKKRVKAASSSSSPSSPVVTPKSSIKRQRYASTPASGISIRKSSSGITSSAPQKTHQKITNRLLLCKRWTVACSKSTRGRINYGEALDFAENWNKNPGQGHSFKEGSKDAMSLNTPVDPMVRFRSSSGCVEGTLNRYLCSILSPLLRLPTASNGKVGCDDKFVSLISIEGEALMEDRALVIGSDVPISLKIYINDPVGFFGLFQNSNGRSNGNTSSKLFFQKCLSKEGSSKLPSYQGKKVKCSFSQEDLVEAAFHLLQWAQWGENLLPRKDMRNGGMKSNSNDNLVGVPVVESDFATKMSKVVNEFDSLSKDESSDEEGGDGYYEENSLESQQVDGLNQVIVSQADQEGKTKIALPELSDPISLKAGVILRPYQRQALYWMCHREGCFIESGMAKKDGKGVANVRNGELNLLSELASPIYSRNSDELIQGCGGKAVTCDCGPVVVGDESVASRAIPVIKYGQNCNEGKEYERNYFHHPLWNRRFLATEDLGTVFAFYVNELLGVASATPPNPPKQCVGGILADAMGLGKTVMLLSLILKTKEAEVVGPSTKDQDILLASGLDSDCARTHRNSASPKKEEVVELLSDIEGKSSCYVMEDDESWTDKQYEGVTTRKKATIKRREKSKRATLVIAPLSLISQWEEELASKTDLLHLLYYNLTKKVVGPDAFSCTDVVITTYGTVQSEFASLSRSSKNGGSIMEPGHNHPLFKFDWKRIILDEAHIIKNSTTEVSKACCMLKADTRWCVTGTPIQNSFQDIYGLLKFLRHEPWCEAAFWKNAMTNISTGVGNASDMVNESGTSLEEEGASSQVPYSLPASTAQSLSSFPSSVGTLSKVRLRRVLAPIILRRTKDTLAKDGSPIVTLPPIDFSTVNVTLSPSEREFYNALLERSQSIFEGFLNAGTASKSWFTIFSLLQRLRQACDHVSLTVDKKVNMGEMAHFEDGSGHSGVVKPPTNNAGENVVDDYIISDLLSKFKRNTDAKIFTTQVAESLSQCIQSNDGYLKSECPICLDEPRVDDAVYTPCAHMFCRDCLLSEFQEQLKRTNKKTMDFDMFKKTGASNLIKVEGGSCPVCHDWVKKSCIIQLEKGDNGELVSKFLDPEREDVYVHNSSTQKLQRDVAARETLEYAVNGASSSKLESVLAEADEVWKLDPGSKILIFSQYLGFLDLIQREVDKLGVACFRIDGKMSLKERVAMIGKFNKDKPAKQNVLIEGGCQRGSVFLVSMKTGGVGLNLVAASSVFIIDPWWNQAVEDQCINRIHRIGQQAKVVRVRKFVVTDSVEEKIVKLQRKKRGMADEILTNGHGGGQLDSTKPALEDFKLLFSI